MSTVLTERLANDEVVLIDGATGTELEVQGVPMVDKAWCAMASASNPETVKAVHAANIEAGAELIIANTFATSRHVLERAGYGDRFDELNTRSVELAIAARDEVAAATGRAPVPVAGAISTTQQGGAMPALDVARINFADQVQLQADAGVDLFMLEMMRDIDQTNSILDAIEPIGLPAWVGWSTVVEDGEVLLFNKELSLAEGLAGTAGRAIDVTLIMHTEVADVDASLDVLLDSVDGPAGVYAHTGHFVQPNWVFNDTISAEDYGRASLAWVERGVQVIGGCCGIGPAHIHHLRDILPAKI